MIAPTAHRFISQRLALNYLDWGNPDAPPLVLVHGGLDHARSWDKVAEVLAPDWHVLALDLRGHGDSAHVGDGNYDMLDFVYDLAELVAQRDLAPLTLIGHSLGGNVTLRFAGLFPEKVRKLVAIEGLGPSPQLRAELEAESTADRLRNWFDRKRALDARQPRRYPDFASALARMRTENAFLSETQARHLTLHGTHREPDGGYRWKFDNHLRVWPPVDLPAHEIEALWSAITCPVLLCYGAESWASNPEKDGRVRHFRNARVVSFPDAGHWLHHDQYDAFMREVRAFL